MEIGNKIGGEKIPRTSGKYERNPRSWLFLFLKVMPLRYYTRLMLVYAYIPKVQDEWQDSHTYPYHISLACCDEPLLVSRTSERDTLLKVLLDNLVRYS